MGHFIRLCDHPLKKQIPIFASDNNMNKNKVMAMKRLLLMSCLLAAFESTLAQVTLGECQTQARDNYPIICQYGLLDKAEDYNLSNASKGYLPQVSASVQASYQSDVPRLPVEIPGLDIKGMSKDQYKAVIQLDQSVWDGGRIKAQRRLVHQEAEVKRRELDASMYMLRERVNQIYFGILSLDEQLRENALLREQLERNLGQVRSYVQNGVANQADVDAVQVELIEAGQKRVALEHTRQAYVRMLGRMTAQEYTSATCFDKPSDDASDDLWTVNRPELRLFDARHSLLDWEERTLKAGFMPRLGVYLQGGYGNPGLNMLEDKFKFYYVAGLRLSWNIGQLYTSRNDRHLLENSRRQVESERALFLYNTHLQMTEQEQALASLKKQMQDDEKVISLRTHIREAAEAKVANGTMSVLDMLREVDKENQARLSKALHEVQWLQTLYQLRHTVNQ